MSLKGKGYEIMGASVFGPPPIHGVHVDFHSGTTMLYGKNGVGKTRLLEQVTQALRGVGRKGRTRTAGSLIHISIDTQPADGDGDFVRALYEMLDVHEDSYREDEYREEFQRAVMARADSWGEFFEDDPMDFLAYPELSTSQGFQISLEPEGTSENRSWSVYLSAVLSEEQHQELQTYARASDDSNRALLEDANTDLMLALKNPFSLARAKEWYLQPFDVRPGLSPGGHEYLVLGSSPIHSWPSSVPVPLIKLGRIWQGPAQVFMDSMPTEEIQQKSLLLVAAGAGRRNPVVEASDDSDVVIAAGARNAALKAVREANRILDLLGDFPFQLRFDTGTPSEWFSGKTPRWVAFPRDQEQISIPLHDLSFSQQRWTRFALSLFLYGAVQGKPLVIILDEPEQGLHRQLETRVARGVQQLGDVFTDVSIMGATHSPAFLDPRLGARLLHLTLTGGAETAIRPLEVGVAQKSLDEESERLGIRPSDLLSMTRVAVIVEGTHDQIVLEECLPAHIRESGARVFVMRGTDHAAALPDMQFLFDALDAPIIVVLDNVVQSRVAPIWQSAVEAAGAGDSKLAERRLDELLSKASTKEEHALVELGRRAVQLGRLGRIIPFGLQRPDILDYLSPRFFNLNFDDWQASKSAFRQEKWRDEGFKAFLRRKYAGKINATTVREAAKAVDTIPDDLLALGNLVRQQGYLGFVDELEVSVEDAN